jgi:hypothetical protein
MGTVKHIGSETSNLAKIARYIEKCTGVVDSALSTSIYRFHFVGGHIGFKGVM